MKIQVNWAPLINPSTVGQLGAPGQPQPSTSLGTGTDQSQARLSACASGPGSVELMARQGYRGLETSPAARSLGLGQTLEGH